MRNNIIILVIGLLATITPNVCANDWGQWNELPTLHQNAIVVRQKALPYHNLHKQNRPVQQAVITEFKSEKEVYSTAYRRATNVNDYRNFVSVSMYNNIGQDAIGRTAAPAMHKIAIAPPPPSLPDVEEGNPTDRLPIGDGILPLLFMALTYAVIRLRRI